MPDLSWSLELTYPAWLAGLAALPLLAWYFRRSLVDFAPWQRALSLACRSVLVVLLVLALADLTLLRPAREPFVVFVVDRSLSVGKESRQDAEAFLDRALAARGEHRAAFLPFAAAPGVVGAERPGATPALDEEGTDLAAAIELAAASVPPSYAPHLVLLTDGNETAGDALAAALRAGVPVSAVPLRPRRDPEVQVSAVRVPAQVREGEPFHVEVVVDATHDDEGVIEVYRGPHRVGPPNQRHKVRKGENRFRFPQALEQERLASYKVRARGFARDTLLDNNAASGLVYSSGRPRVLLVDGSPKRAAPLRDALEEEGIDVEVRPPRGVPDSLTDLQNYELLILSNVPATDLTHQKMEVARSYVKAMGGGLVMLGGDQSFGLGGYYKTALEEVLPVRSDFEKEREKPSLAMVLVLDRSGSMSGQKLELAKEAAKNAVELLSPRDRVGVIAFDSEFHWVSELQPCSDKAGVIDRIARIQSSGGTVMHPPLAAAFEALRGAPAKFRHVICLTDGQLEDGADFDGLAANMLAERITVSSVAVGPDADRNRLERIARAGGGRFYPAEDPTAVPQIFAKETTEASKSAIDEAPFAPQRVRPSPVLAGIAWETAPDLLGYVRTRPRATSEVILATEKGDPLLAWWRHGLGMSVAFTSDASGRWAANWLTWPGYQRFWVQLVRHAMRKSDARGILVQVEQRGRRASVTLDAVEPSGRFLNRAETELTVIDPQLAAHPVAMRQTAPGRYAAEFDTPGPGGYHLSVVQKQQGRVVYQQSRGLAVGYADELRLRPTNEGLLRAIAEATGGRYDPAPEEVFAARGDGALRAVPLWPYLVAAALVLFVADVALRRLDFAVLLAGLRARSPVASSGAQG